MPTPEPTRVMQPPLMTCTYSYDEEVPVFNFDIRSSPEGSVIVTDHELRQQQKPFDI